MLSVIIHSLNDQHHHQSPGKKIKKQNHKRKVTKAREIISYPFFMDKSYMSIKPSLAPGELSLSNPRPSAVKGTGP